MEGKADSWMRVDVAGSVSPNSQDEYKELPLQITNSSNFNGSYEGPLYSPTASSYNKLAVVNVIV